MQRTLSGRQRFAAASLTLGATLLAIGLATSSADAVIVNPTHLDYDSNPKCGDAEVGSFPSDFKIDEQPPAGDSTWDTSEAELDEPVPASLEIVISNLVSGGGTVTFDWSATVADGDDADTDRDPFLIDRVLVKAGPGANMWTYDPAASSDTGLYSPKDSISHINFCFGPHDGGTTDDGTTTDGTTTDGTTTDGTTTDGTTTDGTTTDGTTTDGTTTDGTTTDGTTTDGTTTDGTTTDGTTTDGTTTDGTTTDGTTTDGTTTDGTTTDGTTTDGGTTDDVLGTDSVNDDGPTDDGGTDDPTTSGGTDDPTTGATDSIGATDSANTDGSTDQAVAGNVLPRTLPATGEDDLSLALLGGAFILIGGFSLLLRREVFIRS